MAGSRPGVHKLKLKAIDVATSLKNGEKFIKWDEESGTVNPVTLKVDPNGYILYWKETDKETDFLDLSVIRDTRSGKYAKFPRDSRLRDAVAAAGVSDTALEERMMTIVYGTDMCNLYYLNFTAKAGAIAEEWTTALFNYATNLIGQNRSPLGYIEKCHTKLSVFVDSNGKIPVKHVVRMFAQHKDDKKQKKVEKALESAGLSSGKMELIDRSNFSLDNFISFLNHHLCTRVEVEKIFHRIGANRTNNLTAHQFCEFLNIEQRDPRLNEILYPYADTAKAQALIEQFEPNRNLSQKGLLSLDGFLQYLLSEENALIPLEKLDISQDMHHSLAHYFINSSHNTYLTGPQLTGKSSVEIYRQALLTGCRCIELDCWDGRGADEEPIITHGFTMCTEIQFKDVLKAIDESAFKVSKYPVILSFENHCSPKQQAKMAQHCRTIFGDKLLTEPLDSHPLEVGTNLPSPSQLLCKILVKNKKRHTHHTRNTAVEQSTATVLKSTLTTTNSLSPAKDSPLNDSECRESLHNSTNLSVVENVGEQTTLLTGEQSTSLTGNQATPPLGEPITPQGVPDKMEDSDSDSEMQQQSSDDQKTEVGTAGQEADAGMEMSALVNYVQPIQYQSFEYAEKKARCFECISFVETQASSLLKEFPVEFVNFNKRQLSRVYPKGTRVDSSNYMPQIFWNAGCQLVALNFQTLDLAMQLNLGIFEYNGRSGYILKPDFMRRKDRQFDPFAESTVDGIVAGSVAIKVISGTFLSEKRTSTFVEVEMYGLPADTVRKKFKTKVVPNNSINPVYDEEPFKFRKVVLPTLATLRLVVYENNQTRSMLGHRVLPLEGLRPGYRHICLRNELNQPLPLATLFVHIKVGDFVPDAFADFAEALSNPIAYLSQLEKHSHQLAVLEEDFDVENEDVDEDEISGACAKSSGAKRVGSAASSESRNNTPVHLQRSGSTVRGSTQLSAEAESLLPQAASMTITSLLTTSSLNDSDVINCVPIQALRSKKNYIKVQSKLDKELDALRKKQEKAKASLHEEHEAQIERMKLNCTKSKSIFVKVQQKSFKRASKQESKKTSTDNASQKNNESMYQKMREEQLLAMSRLRREQHRQELDLKMKYHPILYDTLTTLATDSQDSQLKRLKEIAEKEEVYLKRRYDDQIKVEIKTLSRNRRDKSELIRVTQENSSRIINNSVQARQQLKDLAQKRKEEILEKYRLLIETIQQESKQVLQNLKDENKVKQEQINNDEKESLEKIKCKSFYGKDLTPGENSHNVAGGIGHNATGGVCLGATGGIGLDATGRISHSATEGIGHDATGLICLGATGGIGHGATGGICLGATGGMVHNLTGGIGHDATGGVGISATRDKSQNATGDKIQNATGQISHNATGQISHNATEEIIHTTTGGIAHDTTGQRNHNSTEQICHSATEEISHTATGVIAHDTTGHISHKATGQNSHNTTGQISYNATGQISYNATGQIRHNATGQIRPNTTGQISHDTTDVDADRHSHLPSDG